MDRLEQIIAQIKADAKANFVPIVRDQTLEALKNLVAELKPSKVLEIGTAVGYSALNMLAKCDCHITTIEKNEQRYQQAQTNFEKAGVSGQVSLLNGDAMDVLQNLDLRGEKFELVFLDGPKGQYIKYLPIIKRLLAANGTIFADNVGLHGLVGHEELVTHKNRTMVRNMQAFLDEVQRDADFDTSIFEIEDGYAIISLK
ncbi:MAG: O-methyltransferase [Clostridia bacterium]|nr:O-methyltransferase [Clostridia bacterium]